MTRNLKIILISAGAAIAVLASAFSLMKRAQEAQANRFDWDTIMSAVQTRGYKYVIAEVEKRLAAHPNDAILHYYRGRLLYDLDKSKEALAEADKAISMGYAQEMSFVLKAMVYGRLLGDYSGQGMMASKALTFDPTYEFAYLVRAEAEYALGDYKTCAADAASYQHMRPDEPDGYEYGLLCLERLGDYAGAQADGLRVLSRDPDSHAGLWRLGRLYALQGLHKRAIKKFSEAIKLSGGRPKYYLDRAASCAAEGDFSCEGHDYYSALGWQEVSGYASYYYLLGSALHRTGDRKPGLAAADSAIGMEPLSPDNYGLRGRLRAELGDTVGAKKDFRKMSELDPARAAEAAALVQKLKKK